MSASQPLLPYPQPVQVEWRQRLQLPLQHNRLQPRLLRLCRRHPWLAWFLRPLNPASTLVWAAQVWSGGVRYPRVRRVLPLCRHPIVREPQLQPATPTVRRLHLVPRIDTLSVG